MGDFATHNLCPSLRRSPRAPTAASGRRDAPPVGLVGAMLRAAATPRPAHSPRRPAEPAVPPPMAHSAQVRHPGAGGTGNSAPRLDASAAKKTSAEVLVRYAQPLKPTARTDGGFPHSL